MKTTLKTAALPECLWQQAGVVNRKPCFKDYDCSQCRFDRAMTRVCRQNETSRRKGKRLSGPSSGFSFWKDRLMKKPPNLRPCIHHMKGHIKFKSCLKSYHCVDCEFDQYFYDQFKVNTVIKPVNFQNIHGVALPVGYYLHPGHTWIKIEGGGMVRMGIDDFASRLLGPCDAVEMTMTGKPVRRSKPALSLVRDDERAGFFSPVSGVIAQVNPRLKKEPKLIHHAPYTDGWILMIYCPDLKADLPHLLFMESSKQFMEKKIRQLYTFLEEKTQLSAADGGELVPDIYGTLPGISFTELAGRFIAAGP